MVLYLLICLISVLAGCGILTLIGVEVDRGSTFFLAPVITLCSLALFMGGLVAGGFTIGEITPAAYTLYLAAAGLGAVRCGKTVLAEWRVLLFLAALPLLILLPSITEGIDNYSGGIAMDGWNYVTFGQSLQQYALGSEGWLPPGVQFASEFGKSTRYISSAFLALLAPLSGSADDTQEVLGRYLGWLFFVYGGACLFFAKAARLSRPLTWSFVLLAVLSGWALKIENGNALDNALALSLFPAIFGIFLLMSVPSLRDGVLLGGIVAAGFYAYPEASAFIIAATLILATQKLIAPPRQLREFRRMSVGFAVALAVCVVPYGSNLLGYLQKQFSATQSVAGPRPGEDWYVLLRTKGYILPGYWGLTPNFFFQKYSGRYDAYAHAIAYLLTLAAIIGLFVLLRRREWGLPLFAVGMTTLYAIALVHFRYDYAGFKILVISWFAIVYAAVVGAELAWTVLSQRSSRSLTYAAAGTGTGVLASVLFLFFLQERVFYRALPSKSIREFKKVSVLENLASGQPVAMLAKEEYANVWAVHFLRKTKLYLVKPYHGSMSDALDRSEPVDPEAIRYVVTDDPHSFDAQRLLSHVGPYYIWDFGRDSWVYVMEIDNPFGMENSDSEHSFWVAKAYTEIHILSRTATTAVISAEFKIQGASDENAQQRIRVATGAGFAEERVISDGLHSFAVPLQPGLNRILLRSMEKAPLLIRATRFSVSTPIQANRPQIRDLENTNGLERDGTDPFFWVGGQDTILTISAPSPGVAELQADVSPGPSLVDRSKARLWIVSQSGIKTEQDLDWGSAKIEIPVRAGANRVILRAIGPSVKVPTDARTMMIGIRNLRTSPLEETLRSK